MLTSRLSKSLLALLVVAGIGAFGLLLAGAESERAWRIFLVNFVFWSGAAIAGVAWSAIFQVANARWPAPPRRMAAACAAYLPIAFLLFLATWFGRGALFPAGDLAFLYARETGALLLLYGMGTLFLYRASGANRAAPQRLAVGLLIVYVSAQTLFAWDFLMWLEPNWTSTLFGAFYVVSGLYAGLAILTVLTVYAGRHGARDAMDFAVLHNLGKLLFSFSLLWAYFFWSQYLVIWYGNLPREIGYILARAQPPWSTLTALVLLMNFLLPFLLLLSRPAKKNPTVLLVASAVVGVGLWLQQYLLAMPSLAPGLASHFGWQEALVSAGFLALFALTCLVALLRIQGANPGQ